jgi:hypothetical protein
MHGNSKRLWVSAGLAAFVALAAMVSTQAGDAQYVGAAKCKMCHMNEHKVWMESKHAKAFDVLKPEEQKKPECVSCHVTGAGKAAAADADLKGVQCESCHGPGSLYKSMDIMNKAKYAADKEGMHKKSLEAGLIIPDEKTCTGCHNPKSPTFKGFEFASAKEKIKHWK